MIILNNSNEMFVFLSPNGNQVEGIGENAKIAWDNYAHRQLDKSESTQEKLLDLLSQGYSFKKVQITFRESKP